MSANTATEVQESTPRANELMAALFGGKVQDPYPVYEELREIGDGIHWSKDLQAYMICRYDDVRRIGSDARTFSSDLFYDSAPSAHDPGNSEHLRFVDATSCAVRPVKRVDIATG